MRFYTRRHKYYCGIDLQTSVKNVCIIGEAGTILVHKNLKINPTAFTRVIDPHRDGLVVAVECVFAWYWIADLCEHYSFQFSILKSSILLK